MDPKSIITERGALLISLDLELMWGIRDIEGAERWRPHLTGARRSVHAILDVFRDSGVAATWAVVGFLFARGHDDLTEFSPSVRPRYADPRLDPYGEQVGRDESSDPMHFAASLIRAIQSTERQEIGTHTFSHYYCLAEGQDCHAFRADLRSAVAIASRYGIELRSMAFPRNQHNPAYDRALLESGILCYRGPQRGWLHRPARPREGRSLRALRLADAYLPVAGGRTTSWSQVLQANGLCNVPGNLFLRPFSTQGRHLERLRLRRVEQAIRRAAVRGDIVHLWWHPENFGVHLQRNISFLRSVLDLYKRHRDSHGLQSLTMQEIASVALKNR